MKMQLTTKITTTITIQDETKTKEKEKENMHAATAADKRTNERT